MESVGEVQLTNASIFKRARKTPCDDIQSASTLKKLTLEEEEKTKREISF